MGQFSSQRRLTASMVAAASAEPPPSPAPTGMRLVMVNATSGSRSAAWAMAKRASTAWLRRMSLREEAKSPK